MLTIEEIRAMTPEQLQAAQAALGRRLIINKIVVPLAVGTAANVLVNQLIKRFSK